VALNLGQDPKLTTERLLQNLGRKATTVTVLDTNVAIGILDFVEDCEEFPVARQ